MNKKQNSLSFSFDLCILAHGTFLCLLLISFEAVGHKNLFNSGLVGKSGTKTFKIYTQCTPKLSKNDVCGSYGFDSNFLLGNLTQIMDQGDLGSFLLSKDKILS